MESSAGNRADSGLTGEALVTSEIEACGIVAILRASEATHLDAVVEALVGAGVRAIELTLTTPHAIEAIARLHDRLGSDAIIGAGTVLEARDAAASIDAGARFIVSPSYEPAVVEVAAARGVTVCPGVLTPSEVSRALRDGVTTIKLFPASTVGPGHLRALRGPFPGLRVIPTGGIAVDQIGTWIHAGAVAVGMGGPLIGDSLKNGPNSGLLERAKGAIEAVSAARTNA